MRKTVICLVYLIMVLVSVMPDWAEGEDLTYEIIDPDSSFERDFDVNVGDEIRFNKSLVYNFTTSWHGEVPRIEFWWEDPQGDIKGYGKIDDDTNWTIPGVHNETGGTIITRAGTWKYICKNNDAHEAITLGYLFQVVEGDDNESGDNSNLLLNIIIASGTLMACCLGIFAGLISTKEPLKHSLFMGLAPLYTKIKKNEVLDQFNRGQIFQYITDNPGVHYNRIKSDLNVKNGVLAYHLKVLEEQEYIKSRKDGKLKRFYNINYAIPQNAAYLNDAQRRIIDIIFNKPGINQIELAKTTDSSPEVISYNINQLVKKGFVKANYVGREVHYHLVEDLDLTKEESIM